MAFDYAVTQRGSIGIRLPDADDSFYGFPVSETMLSRTAGAMLIAIQSDVAFGAASSFTLIDVGFDVRNRYVLRWEDTLNRLEFYIISGDDKYSITMPALLEANIPYLIGACWAGPLLRLFYNGEMEQLNKGGPVPVGSFPAYAYVGNSITTPETTFDGILWNMVFLDHPIGLNTFLHYEDFYRNFRLADFIFPSHRLWWYGNSEGRERYRLGN